MSNLLERSSNTLILGSIIQGRYQVLSKIKGGALSRTYLVQDLSQPNEPKCVLKHYPYNKEIPRLYKTNMRLFLKEAKHLQVLSIHPQIPRLIDYFGITDQGWYLIQEIIDGKLLNNTLPMSEYSDNCWSFYEVARFVHDVTETLQFIHSQKIIHCDLKPNNLIRRATDGRVVILDFGSAQYIPGFQTNEDASITSLRTKITVSPSGYLAPEQLNGNPQPCSDFYALGIMAIQAWTGLDPARMKKDNHTGEVVWDQYVKIENPDACRQLVAIIARMVQPDIGDRYRHARDLLADLDVFLNTFQDKVEEEIDVDYGKISFDDASLFKKPAPEELKKKVKLPVEEPGISKVDINLPSEAMKATLIQVGDDGENTVFQGTPIIEFDEDEFLDDLPETKAGFAEPEKPGRTDFKAEELPQKLKRQKVGMSLPMVAGMSVLIVLLNAFLIAFGLQHLIKNMATADAPPQPSNDEFQRAQAAYAQGDLQEAIAIAQAIPQQNPNYTEAQTNISQWQQEWQVNQQRIDAIKAAHSAQNWQEVVKLGKELGNNALAQQQVGDLITAAQFQIDVAAYQRVQKAFNLAADYEFTTAMATLQEAPPNSKFAPVITAKLEEYETKKQVRAQYYLQQAVNHAEAREFSEAVAFLEKIPPESTHSDLAEIKIVEYTEKQQIKEAYERWAAAKSREKATQFVKGTPMAQLNPGMVWQDIA